MYRQGTQPSNIVQLNCATWTQIALTASWKLAKSWSKRSRIKAARSFQSHSKGCTGGCTHLATRHFRIRRVKRRRQSPLGACSDCSGSTALAAVKRKDPQHCAASARLSCLALWCDFAAQILQNIPTRLRPFRPLRPLASCGPSLFEPTGIGRFGEGYQESTRGARVNRFWWHALPPEPPQIGSATMRNTHITPGATSPVSSHEA